MHKNTYTLLQSKDGVMDLIVTGFFSNMAFTLRTIVQTVSNSEFLKC